MSDKRTTHRLDIQLPAYFETKDQEENLSIATTVNISATGISLASKKKLNVGQELPIQINILPEETIIINVKIIWVKETYSFPTREYVMGIKIQDAMQADESKFVKFYAGKLLKFFKENRDKKL